MNLEELLNNKKLDVLQILFNAIAEDLAIITKDDKSNLEIVDSQLNYQYQKLKEEFQKSSFEHKDKIANTLQHIWICMMKLLHIIIKNILKSGVKTGIKLMAEAIK